MYNISRVFLLELISNREGCGGKKLSEEKRKSNIIRIEECEEGEGEGRVFELMKNDFIF